MRTTKTISTISYNSYEFLKNTLDNEVKNKRLNWYAFIKHLPEEDEKKEHFHVFMIPNRIIDTGEYRDIFNEYFENGFALEIPRKCLPIDASKFFDWYMYNKHDISYLASKFESRKYHYDKEDFVTSDEDYFDKLVKDCGVQQNAVYLTMLQYISQGLSFTQFLIDANVPDSKVIIYEHAWNNMIKDGTSRYMRKNHEESEE